VGDANGQARPAADTAFRSMPPTIGAMTVGKQTEFVQSQMQALSEKVKDLDPCCSVG